MTDLSTVKTPYSAIAVQELVALELEHKSFFYNLENGEPLCGSIICETLGLNANDDYTILYPCPTLLAARGLASEETLVAVTLIMGGDK